MTEMLSELNTLLKDLSPESAPVTLSDTLSEIEEVIADLSDIKAKVLRTIKLCETLCKTITPSTEATRNEVLTIGGYIAEGYSPEEATLVRKHDILWNEYVNGTITLGNYAELAKIWEMDIL